jgi:hypothetical protein
MNWEAIGSLAEATSVLLVLVSILYLAVQVRQNTNTVKGASHHAVTDTFNAISTLIAQNTEMARLWRLGNMGLENLTEDEQTSYSYLCIMYMRVFETIYYQRKIGTMTEQLYLAEEQTLKWSLTQPGHREWWESNPISFSVEFREYIASLNGEIEASSPNENKSEPR